MKHSTTTTVARLFALAGAALSTTALLGCQGHGKYVTEGITKAEARLGDIKAGTSWDMARQQFLAGDLSKALKSVDQSLSINKNIPKSHTLRGRILIELGQLEPAIESFKKALAIEPSFVEAHYYSGIIHERFREYDEALEKYQAASALDPSSVQYILASAEVLIEMGRFDDAYAMLTEQRSRFDHNAGLRQTLGHLAMMRRDWREAAELFSSARMLAPEDSQILEDLALAQIASKQFAEADFTLRKLLNQPENAERRDLRHARARCLMQLDRPVEARTVLLSLAGEPEGENDLAVWSDLGQVALKLNDMQRVRIVANRMTVIAPHRPEGPLLMAAQRYREGDYAAALESVEQAIALDASSATAYMFQGFCQEALARPLAAQESFERAAALDPSGRAMSKALATVDIED